MVSLLFSYLGIHSSVNIIPTIYHRTTTVAYDSKFRMLKLKTDTLVQDTGQYTDAFSISSSILFSS